MTSAEKKDWVVFRRPANNYHPDIFPQWEFFNSIYRSTEEEVRELIVSYIKHHSDGDKWVFEAFPFGNTVSSVAVMADRFNPENASVTHYRIQVTGSSFTAPITVRQERNSDKLEVWSNLKYLGFMYEFDNKYYLRMAQADMRFDSEFSSNTVLEGVQLIVDRFYTWKGETSEKYTSA